MRIQDSMTMTVWSAEVMRPRAKAILSVMPASVIMVLVRKILYSSWRSVSRLTLEEEDGLVGNQVAGQVLGSVDAADDEGTVKVDTAEKLEVGRLLGILLKLDGTTHHSNGLMGVRNNSLASETADGLGCLVEAAFANKPPGGLGS